MSSRASTYRDRNLSPCRLAAPCLTVATTIALAFVAFIAGTTRAASVTDFVLQPAEGGSKSLLTWTFGGDWLAPSNVVSGPSGMNYLGMFAVGAAAPSLVSGTFSVSGAGTYNNLTTGSNFVITQVGFLKIGSSDLAITLQPSAVPVAASSGEQMRYTPGTDSYVFDIPFSSFFPGTYLMNSNGITDPPNVQTLTIMSIPEPSTCIMALAGLAYGGFSMWRRKRA